MRRSIQLAAISSAFLMACSGGGFSGGSKHAEAPANSATKDDSADGSSGEPSPLPSPEQVNALKEKCANAQEASFKTLEQSITYPERKTCSFGTSPNLEQRNSYVQAFETSPATMNLPDGEICGIEIQSPAEARLHYDDFLILAIDSRIVFLSNGGLTSYLDAPEQGILTWDFAKLAGKRIQNFEAAAYCLGKRESCVLPAHDKEGSVALHLKTNEIAPIAAAITGRTSVSMNLIATGDNDATDCFHSALTVAVKIKYLP